MFSDNNELEDLDYRYLKEEIVADINYIFASGIEKDIDAKYYSVGIDPHDNAIVVIFFEEMHDQKDTADALAEFVTTHINAEYVQPNTIVQFLKTASRQNDIYAVIKAFYIS